MISASPTEMLSGGVYMDLGLSVLAGAGISALAGLGGSAMGAHAASNLNSNTREFLHREAIAADARQLANAKDLFYTQQYMGPQYTVKGLKSAGLNPVLATGSMSGGSMPSFSAHMPSGNPNPNDVSQYYTQGANSIANAIGMFLQGKNLEADIALKSANAYAVRENALSQAKVAEANSNLANMKSITESHMPEKVKADLLRISISNLLDKVKTDYLQSQIPVNAKTVENLNSQIENRKEMLELARKTGKVSIPGVGEVKFNPANLGKQSESLFETIKHLFKSDPVSPGKFKPNPNFRDKGRNGRPYGI